MSPSKETTSPSLPKQLLGAVIGAVFALLLYESAQGIMPALRAQIVSPDTESTLIEQIGTRAQELVNEDSVVRPIETGEPHIADMVDSIEIESTPSPPLTIPPSPLREITSLPTQTVQQLSPPVRLPSTGEAASSALTLSFLAALFFRNTKKGP
jgi:hypothetical protein